VIPLFLLCPDDNFFRFFEIYAEKTHFQLLLRNLPDGGRLIFIEKSAAAVDFGGRPVYYIADSTKWRSIMFQVIAIVSLKKGEAENFKKLLPAIVGASKTDKGNISYQCDQDALNPDVFLFQERWESDEALEEHLAQPHFKEFAAAIESLIAAPLAMHKIML